MLVCLLLTRQRLVDQRWNCPAVAVQGCSNPLEKVGVRRLLLEHTYVQLNENNMHNALLSY